MIAMNDSPIFIVGCPRSGTTLLKNLLSSHPNLTFPNESHFIPKLYRAYGNPKDSRSAIKLARTILSLDHVRLRELPLQPSSFADCRSYREIISRVYQAWSKKKGKIRWGDKTPQYVAEIPTLLEIFPSCKIIHIYRDGRDVALSWLNQKFGPENIFTAASRWKYFVNAGRRAGASLSSQSYLEISYEALLASTEETMRRVCAFVEEPFFRNVLTPNSFDGQLSVFRKKKKSVSNSEIIKSNSGKWKYVMSPSDRVVFESIAGELLNALGYETDGKTRHISAFERVQWELHHNIRRFRQIFYMRNPHKWIMDNMFYRWTEVRTWLGRFYVSCWLSIFPLVEPIISL